MNLKIKNTFKIKNCYFGPDDEEEVVEDEKPVTPPAASEEKTFTQEQLNKFLAEERRKAQRSNEKVVKQLEELKKNQSLTEEEKQSLEGRIETIRNEALSKEELAKKEAQKERNKQKTELEAKEKEAVKWKKLYEENTIETGLMKAATSDPDIFNPQQVVELLHPKTHLVEELDENNNPTGKFIARVRFMGKDKDSNDVLLDLSPEEVVKQMKDMPEKHGNLFVSKATGGLGGNNSGRINTGGNKPPLENAAEYREWRKKNKGFSGM